MGLAKLGSFIEQSELRNAENIYGDSAVVGLSTAKQMIKTKADLDGVSLTSYKQLPPRHFAYVPDTSRRGDKMSLGYNTSCQTFLVSSISVVFRVSDTDSLNSDYLYIYFNRPEFDRYARFNSSGSQREAFSWEEMCEIAINLPPLPIQQKYVDVHNAMLANQQAYEHGLDDLKLTCDAYIERLRRQLPHKAIGAYITLSDARNNDLFYDLDSVQGVSIDKRFINTKADMEGVSLKPYYLVSPDAFAYVTVTSRNGEKISLAHNGSDDTYICSTSYVVFEVTNKEKLIPSYLRIFFNRPDFDRFARFNSWGSARETFSWFDMCEVKIPIPDIAIQRSIVDIYNAYIERRGINERLKAQMKDICPILIKGSLDEAGM
jgi:type I restriction enzyme S subunit